MFSAEISRLLVRHAATVRPPSLQVTPARAIATRPVAVVPRSSHAPAASTGNAPGFGGETDRPSSFLSPSPSPLHSSREDAERMLRLRLQRTVQLRRPEAAAIPSRLVHRHELGIALACSRARSTGGAGPFVHGHYGDGTGRRCTTVCPFPFPLPSSYSVFLLMSSYSAYRRRETRDALRNTTPRRSGSRRARPRHTSDTSKAPGKRSVRPTGDGGRIRTIRARRGVHASAGTEGARASVSSGPRTRGTAHGAMAMAMAMSGRTRATVGGAALEPVAWSAAVRTCPPSQTHREGVDEEDTRYPD